MANINENVNYLDKTYPLYKLCDKYPDRIYYMIYFEKTEDENKPILFNINNIENKLDKCYMVEYIEYIDENKSIVKALGVGFGTFCSFKDIEILNDDLGKPNAIISENVKKKLSIDLAKIHLSISDERCYVISYAVVEK